MSNLKTEIVLLLKVNGYHRRISLQKQRFARELPQSPREVEGVMAKLVQIHVVDGQEARTGNWCLETLLLSDEYHLHLVIGYFVILSGKQFSTPGNILYVRKIRPSHVSSTSFLIKRALYPVWLDEDGCFYAVWVRIEVLHRVRSTPGMA